MTVCFEEFNGTTRGKPRHTNTHTDTKGEREREREREKQHAAQLKEIKVKKKQENHRDDAGPAGIICNLCNGEFFRQAI